MQKGATGTMCFLAAPSWTLNALLTYAHHGGSYVGFRWVLIYFTELAESQLYEGIGKQSLGLYSSDRVHVFPI